MKKQSLEKLTGLTAASIAMGVSTEAAIIASPTVPSGGLTTPSSLGTIYWDIDNDGTDDFSFTLSSLYTNITSSIQTVLKMADLGDARVAGVDGNPLHFKQLTGGTYLGTTSDGFSFSPTARNRSILSFWSSTVSSYLYLGTDLNDGGWSLGDTGYFGFKFTSNGNTHYGWAEMTLSTTSAQATINEAWYNDTPDGIVEVGVAIPEPAEVGLGLGVLALGAAGLRRMRQNCK